MAKFTGMFEKALEFAIKKHKGQKRKSTNMPYFRHPISVAENIEEIKKSKNIELLMTAAILHDTVEDCAGVTIQEIAKKFGFYVAALVEELTSDPKQIAKIGKTTYLKKKMEKMTSYTLVIKLADRRHNVKDMSETTKEFQKKYTQETNEILEYLESGVRKLTETHQKLIDKIKEVLKNQKSK
ncbi:MAG: HD domain-containing protein [candidate division SR1 bacterium]|nr:HD domain-containing protein [candidate division SR1 bacterium]